MTLTLNSSLTSSRSFTRSSSRLGGVLALAAAALFGSNLASAQSDADPAAAARVAPGACPHPVNLTLTKNSGPSSPVLANFPAVVHPKLAGSMFNQTAVNKFFAHTFQFKPREGDCCQFQTGKLVVTYKALKDLTANDTTVVIYNGGADRIHFTGNVGDKIWATPPAVGATVTHTFVIPANVMASGMVNLVAQDDTAVVSATLTVAGCCLAPTPALKP